VEKVFRFIHTEKVNHPVTMLIGLIKETHAANKGI